MHSAWRAAASSFTIGLIFFSTPSFSMPITTSFIRGAGEFWAGMAVDSQTGVAYQLNGYGPGPGSFGTNPTTLTTYSDSAAFETNSSSGILTSATNLWGTYISAHDGSVFGRSAASFGSNSWPDDAQTSKISGLTGTVQGTVTTTGMGGSNNSTDVFDWGGFSSANVLNDGSRLYVVGGDDASTDWRITTYDYSLNELTSVTFTPLDGQPGFAFSIGGYVFIGDDYNSGQISQRVNAATGVVDAIDFLLTVRESSIYLNNISYDAFNDVLYLNSRSIFYKVNNAAQVFGVTSSVSEPTTLALMGLGLAAGIGYGRRRSKKAV